MKPKNFPGRKNKRRLIAVTTLEAHPRQNKRIKQEIKNLNSKIFAQDIAESIRTKKNRKNA